MEKLSVLIIEDDVFITQDIVEIVTAEGCEIAGKAKSYEEALKRCKEATVNLIISDIRIQGERDGLQSVRLLQNIVDAPVIFITSFNDNDLFMRVAELDFVGFLMKPFKEHQLGALVKIALNRFELSKQKSIKPLGGGFSYCEKERVVYREGAKIVLTENEKLLFELLYHARNSIVPYGIIDEIIWSDAFPDDNKRRQLLHRLTHKLKDVEFTVKRGEGCGLVVSA